MARPKEKPEFPEQVSNPAPDSKTENVTGKGYKFLKDYRLLINGEPRLYKKDDVITSELFQKNYPYKSGELFLKGLIDAEVLK